MAARCAWCKKPLKGRQVKFCGVNCSTYVALRAWRRRTKLRAVASLGGRCQKCGYAACAGAMIFHHPGHKSFGISQRNSWKKIERELKKCTLLCLNCHAEEHCENEEHSHG